MRTQTTRYCAGTALIATTLIFSGCAALQPKAVDGDFERHIYGGVGLLASQVEPDTDGVTGVSVDESQSAGGSVVLGMDLNNRFSVEGHLANLGEATLSPEGSIAYTVGGISGLLYGLNDERDRDRREGFSAYGKLGVGAMSNSAEDVEYERINDVHLLAGVGMEYGLLNGVAFRAELVAHETDAKFAQLGVIYRFDRRAQRAVEAEKQTELEPDTDTTEVVTTPVPAMVAKPIPDTTDSDGDGILADADLCPDSAAGQPVKDDGCAMFDGVIEGITFEPGSATLTESATVVLSGVASTLQEYPELSVAIEAHTDNQGSAESNLRLSKRRAIAVAGYLVDQGIRGSRLKPQAFGESRPRTSNLTSQGRAANRRVEFSVLGDTQ